MKIKTWKNMTTVQKDGKKYVLFFGYKCPFSNMYNHLMTQSSQNFTCVEQGFAYRKAELFDASLCDKILQAKTGPEFKKLGRDVKNFDAHVWNGRRSQIMERLIYAKFQDPTLAKLLKLTENAELIEVSPYDKFWGAGVDKDIMIRLIEEGRPYPGQNRLGLTLMWMRDNFVSKAY